MSLRPRAALLLLSLLFLSSPLLAKPLPLVVRVEEQVVPGELAEFGWSGVDVTIVNSAENPVTAVIHATGREWDHEMAPSLGKRAFPPIIIPARSSVIQSVYVPSRWKHLSFGAFSPSGDLLSDPRRGDTILQTLENPRGGGTAIFTSDPSWGNQISNGLSRGARFVLESVPERLSSPKKHELFIVDLLAPPDNLVNLEGAVRNADDAGRPVVFVARGARPAILENIAAWPGSHLVDSRVLRRMNHSSHSSVLYQGRNNVFLLDVTLDTSWPADWADLIRWSFSGTSFEKTDKNPDGLSGLMDDELLRTVSSRPPYLPFIALLGLYSIFLLPLTFFFLARRKLWDRSRILIPLYGGALTLVFLALGVRSHGTRDQVAILDVERNYLETTGDGIDPSPQVGVRRETILAIFSATTGEKKVTMRGVNAGGTIAGRRSGEQAAGPAVFVSPTDEDLTVSLPILFWAGRVVRFASITSDTTGCEPEDAGEVTGADIVYIVENGRWIQGEEDFVPDPPLARIAAVPNYGKWIVAVDNLLPRGLALPEKMELRSSRRVRIWRAK